MSSVAVVFLYITAAATTDVFVRIVFVAHAHRFEFRMDVPAEWITQFVYVIVKALKCYQKHKISF